MQVQFRGNYGIIFSVVLREETPTLTGRYSGLNLWYNKSLQIATLNLKEMKMKAGDIVAVHDGSWSMSVINGSLEHVRGNNLGARRFRVLSTGGDYPTCDFCKVEPNDVMLIDTNDPGHVLFIRQNHCRIVTSAPSAPLDTVHVAIPHGVTTVKLHFDKTVER